MPDLAGYADAGFAAPIRVLAAARAKVLRDRVLAVRRDRPEDADKALGINCHLLFPWLYDLTLCPPVLDAVERVIGSDILVWSAGFFLKDAGDGRYVSWHQDSTYWGLDPPDIVTAWIALTPSTPESGCMRVVPGSHRWGQLSHADSFADGNMLSRGQEVEVAVDEARARDIVLQPGEMSLHHVRIVHGSGANCAAHARIGFAVRYVPPRVRQHGGRTFAVLARGRDRYGHFDAPQRPDAALSDGAWRMQQESLRRANAVLMHGAAEESRVAGHTART